MFSYFGVNLGGASYLVKGLVVLGGSGELRILISAI